MRVRITYDGPFYVLSKRTTIFWFIPWWETVLMSADLEYVELEYLKLINAGDERMKNLIRFNEIYKHGEKS